jgi:hypothetical protein
MGVAKKQKTKSMIKVPIFLAFVLCKFCYSCASINSDTIPAIYINNTTVSPKIYKVHQEVLKDSIRLFIENKSLAYYSKENDSQTEIIIDSVLYSPKKDKGAFFVITKNSKSKLIGGGNRNEYHYDAHCFTFYLYGDSIISGIYWVKAFNVSNFYTKEKASNRIREMYFKEFSKSQDVNGNSMYKFNLNDIRFWDGPIWQTLD